MLYVFGFDSVAVAVCDLYFFDPEADHGAERGVRLELRLLERATDPDDIFAAVPVTVGRPLWRVDLLESVDHPGTLDRAHQHSVFDGWNPGEREFTAEMTDNPVRWLGGRLEDLSAAVPGVTPEEADRVRDSVAEIGAAVVRLLNEVRAGRLGQRAQPATGEAARVGWL